MYWKVKGLSEILSGNQRKDSWSQNSTVLKQVYLLRLFKSPWLRVVDTLLLFLVKEKFYESQRDKRRACDSPLLHQAPSGQVEQLPVFLYLQPTVSFNSSIGKIPSILVWSPPWHMTVLV